MHYRWGPMKAVINILLIFLIIVPGSVLIVIGIIRLRQSESWSATKLAAADNVPAFDD